MYSGTLMADKRTIIEFDGLKLDAEETLKAIERYECEQSLEAFVKAAWPTLDPAPLEWSWHLSAMCEHLEAVCDGAIKRLILNVPPRSSKSSIITLCFPAWVWCQSQKGPTSGPQVSFLAVSYNESLSMEFNVAARRLIKSSWYSGLWGDRYNLLDDADTKSAFQNDKGGKRFIASIGSRVTGKGADIIILDDPNATNDAESDAVLKTTNDFYDNTLRSRLNNKKYGSIICVQQRVAENDLTGHLLEKYGSEFEHFMVPMEYDPGRSFTTSIGWKDPRTVEGELLWPERFDEEFVKAERRNPWSYASQYQQSPAPKGGGIIKSDWFNLYNAENSNGKLVYPPFDFIVASCDTAYAAKAESDHSAMTIWGVFFESLTDNAATRYLDANGNVHYGEIGPKTRMPKLMLIYAWSANLEFHELIERVAAECKRYKVDRLLVEAKASGISVAQELKRLYRNEKWNVQLINPGNMDKVARLHSVVPIFANGLVYAPDKAWAQMVIDQTTQFPKSRYKDIVDTLSQALRHLRDIGLLETREEVEVDLEEAMTFGGNQSDGMYF